jgi:hypothetical protein
MEEDRTDRALSRIDAALSRLEVAAACSRAPSADLEARHDQLRQAVTQALGELDALIGQQAG